MGSIGVEEAPLLLSDRCKRLLFELPHWTDEKLENCLKNTKYVGKFQFGDVYLGNYDHKDVAVKIWRQNEGRNKVLPGENEGRLEDEIILQNYFHWYEFHPNLAKLQYFCRSSKYLAAIYNLKPKAIDTLHNLIERDDFAWAQRVRVGFGLASLLRYMHTRHPKCPSNAPYLIRNIDVAHILVDQDYEALLFDFSMISGGILTDKRELLNQKMHGCSGYSDAINARPGKWSDKCDVFSYGAVLLSLISKTVYKDENGSAYLWAKDAYDRHHSVASGNNFSLVHSSLKLESDFNFEDAVAITNLAIKCLQPDTQERPTMKEVVAQMQDLHIVQQNANTWECCRMLDGVNQIFLSKHISKDRRVKESWQCSEWHWGLPLKYRMHKFKGLGLSLASEHILARCRLSGSKPSIGEDNAIGVFSYEQLFKATDGFSKQNLIGKFQFGKVFWGETREKKRVTVKIWECIPKDGVFTSGNEDQLRDEISLLQHPELLSLRNVVKMIGYCFEDGKLGAVYDLDPLDSLYNLAPKDEFSWHQRMGVIYEFANLLMYLHTPNPPHAPYRVGNLDASHIILDKEYCPKLLDFGMTVGGIILNSRERRIKEVRKRSSYYCDYNEDSFYEARDILAFGCIILCLIHKRVHVDANDRFDLHLELGTYHREHLKCGGNSNEYSFVHETLKRERDFDENDGFEITKLAMECVDFSDRRPSMEDVVTRLGELQVIKKNGHLLKKRKGEIILGLADVELF